MPGARAGRQLQRMHRELHDGNRRFCRGIPGERQHFHKSRRMLREHDCRQYCYKFNDASFSWGECSSDAGPVAGRRIVMRHGSDLQGRASVTGSWPRLRRSRIGSGQTMVEFAMVSVLALVIMIVGVQFAMIGQAALALSQGASAIARYAAVYEPQ